MNREELVKTLEFVSNALADKLTPILECFCFTGETVYAYNDAIAIVAPCEFPPCAVDGKTLLGLLNNSQAHVLEFQQRDNELWIKAHTTTFRLPYHQEKDFVFIKEPKPPTNKIKWSNDLAFAFAACLEIASKELTQEALCGVYLRNGALFASDGDAIIKVKGDLPNIGPYLFSNAFVQTLLKAAAKETEPPVDLRVDGEWAYAKVEGVTIYGRIPVIPNPIDFDQDINDMIKGKVSYIDIPGQTLDKALSRARVVADPESERTVLTVKEGQLHLVTTTHMGIVRDKLRFSPHPNVTAEVSAAHVQRSINLCTEMAITEGCTVYRKGESLLIVLTNYGS